MLKPLKTEKEEEKLEDKHQKDLEFTAPHPNRERNMTSLLSSRSKSEGGSQQFSVKREYSNSGIKPVDHISRKTNDIYTLKLSKARKDKMEIKFKCPGSTNYDVMMSDVIVTGANGDVTMRHVLVGKRSHAYIFPSADFWASCLYYLNTYIVNLESDHNFTIFFELIFLYIYNVYRSGASCNWATYTEVISVNIYTLVYFSSNLIVLLIKSHDKYQSLILIGLARAGKANSGNRSILVHYRSY